MGIVEAYLHSTLTCNRLPSLPNLSGGGKQNLADARTMQTRQFVSIGSMAGASIIGMEQVSELDTLDHVHGLLTDLNMEALHLGYVMLGKSTLRHSQVGGLSSRHRTFPSWEHADMHMVLPDPEPVVWMWQKQGSLSTVLIDSDCPDSHCIDLSQGHSEYVPHKLVQIKSDAPTVCGILTWGGPGTVLQLGILCRAQGSSDIFNGLFSITEIHGDWILLIRRPRQDSRKIWVRRSSVILSSFIEQATEI